MWLMIATPIGNMMHLKYLIHPMEEIYYWQPDKIKEEALQGSSSTTTIMVNSRRFPRSNVISLLNGASSIIMAVSSINMTK